MHTPHWQRHLRAQVPLLMTLFVLGAESSTANVLPWTPEGVSSPQFESHAAFDPLNGDFYFVRSSPKFEGWRILVSHCTAHGWSEPTSPPFAGDGVEADPWFTPDGEALYFISTRSTDGVKRKDLDIWRIARTDAGFGERPVRLPEPVNSSAQEWFPDSRPTAGSTLDLAAPVATARPISGVRASMRRAVGQSPISVHRSIRQVMNTNRLSRRTAA